MPTRSPLLALAAAALCFAAPAAAPAAVLSSLPGLEGLGRYSGVITYDPVEAELKITLTNDNLPGVEGGYITAFAFNNPGDRVTGVTLISNDVPFVVLGDVASEVGGLPYTNDIAASPFGDLDLGAGLPDKDKKGGGGPAKDANFNGNGSPTAGIAAGASASFTFQFTGTGLDTLSLADFFGTTVGGPPGFDDVAFLVRFKGYEGTDPDYNDGSDKVPGTLTQPTPVTPAALLMGVGGVVLAAARRFRRPAV